MLLQTYTSSSTLDPGRLRREGRGRRRGRRRGGVPKGSPPWSVMLVIAVGTILDVIVNMILISDVSGVSMIIIHWSC